jgi:hypothetical protein
MSQARRAPLPKQRGANNDRKSLLHIDVNRVLDRRFSPYGSMDELNDMTPDEVFALLKDLYAKWGGDDFQNFTRDEVYQFGKEKFPYEDNIIYCYQLYQTYINQCACLYLACTKNGMLATKYANSKLVHAYFWQITVVSTKLYDCVSAATLARNSCRMPIGSTNASLVNTMAGNFNNMPFLSKQDQAMEMILKLIGSLELRRHNDLFYRKVYAKAAGSKKRVFINSYEHYWLVNEADTIAEVVNALPSIYRMSAHWNTMTQLTPRIIESLKTMNNTHLPRLVTNPEYMSFKTGQLDLVSLFYYFIYFKSWVFVICRCFNTLDSTTFTVIHTLYSDRV